MKFSRDKKIIVLLLIAFHFFLFTGLYLEGLEPVSSNKNSLPQIVEITKGENLFSIANKLKEKGLIRSRIVFVIEALRSGKYKEFKAGEYALYPYQGIEEIFEILKKGKVYLHKITVFEGATLWEIADILEKNQICSKKEFLVLAQKEEFVKSLDLPGPTVEGYLYPETYFFPKDTTPEKVIKVMTDKFKEVWKELEPYKMKSPLSLKEIVILASIVEKEAFFNEEKPLIAGVYLNRIKKGMPLQADPTINYALKNFRRLTYKDYYSVKSPYNTYLNSGFPPTPIGNPSKSSLLAVLKPAKVPYLYFVADGNGRHIFSRTYKEHLTAILKVRATKSKEIDQELSNKTAIESKITSESVTLQEDQAKPEKEIKSL